MFLGLLLIGSIVGVLAAAVAVTAGLPLSMIVALYFAGAMLSVGTLVALCAVKHRIRTRRLRTGLLASR